MNKGHRIAREDTYEDGFKNLEDYPSNMNDIRWRIQNLYMHYCFRRYFDDESFYYKYFD